ncbi:hypothetical protein D3C83_156350 [compost metagenome]
MRVMIFFASASRPRVTSQRGLSAVIREITASNTAGTTPMPNIQRQPASSAHAASPHERIVLLTKNTTKMPVTIAI